jgi:hypothetical protein
MNLLVESRTPVAPPDDFLPHYDALRSGSASDCTRRPLQKLLKVYIRAGWNSTLREVAASTAAPSDG